MLFHFFLPDKINQQMKGTADFAQIFCLLFRCDTYLGWLLHAVIWTYLGSM